MRTSNLIKKIAIVNFFILPGLFFSNCNNHLLGEKDIQGNTTIPANESDRICKLVKSDEIRNALAKSKMNKVILNIYPVKLSNASKKKDFDLRFVFQDGSEKNKALNNTVNVKLFETQTNWYIGYLKSKNIPMNKIPAGYFLEMDSRTLNNSVGLSFCMKPGEESGQYYLLSEKSGKDANDTTCKCPPVCCKFKIMSMDSTGKCPPDCPIPPLMYESMLRSLIAKNYKGN